MRNSKIRTLERAVEALGGAGNLATYLNVKLSQLEDWVVGRVEIPPEVFGAALDVVAAGPFAAWSGKDDAKLAERRQAHADRLQQTAQRIKASAERAQRIADQAQRSADRSGALAQLQRALANAKLVGEKSTDK
jgi:hypothetical protein